MISKTKIGRRLARKSDNYIAETMLQAKRNKGWLKISQSISGGRRRYSSVNLKQINEEAKDGDSVLVIGKVLGTGDVDKKIRVCALYFSESAKEKLKKQKGEVITILEEIKKNPKAEGLKLIR